MMLARRLVPLLPVVLAACGSDAPTLLPPNGQLLLYVNTDAPLPAAPGDRLGPEDATPLFDRVRIEVYPPDKTEPCVDCTHEFDVDRTTVSEGRASVGITTPPGISGYRVRVRLFRAAFVELGEPRADSAIDVTASLPTTAVEGITPVTVFLHTDDVAQPVGSLAEPVPAALGVADRGLVGTWPGGRHIPCTSTPRPGEVCIPGGAYWMGNPQMSQLTFPGDALVMRLVVLSPFFLDATEVTVSAFRTSNLASKDDPLERNFTAQPPAVVHCTWTPQPGNFEELPLNGTSWEKAHAYCQSRGADLPTEAQFQYASSGLRGKLYVWGDDQPTCDDAVYGRSQLVPSDIKCPGEWVEPPGRGKRDRLVLPTGVVVDLAGNLAEYALDDWSLATGSCWGTGVFHDPVCVRPGSLKHTGVGGAFLALAAYLAASVRRPTFLFADAVAAGPEGGYLAQAVASTGFRCARPDRP